MPKITTKFLLYDSKKVESDLRKGCIYADSCKSLPKMSEKVGGDTDILIGSKYLRYFAKLAHDHGTELRIHESVSKAQVAPEAPKVFRNGKKIMAITPSRRDL